MVALTHFVLVLRMAYFLGRDKRFSRSDHRRELDWYLRQRWLSMFVYSGGAPLIATLSIELTWFNAISTSFYSTPLLNQLILPAVLFSESVLAAAIAILWMKTSRSDQFKASSMSRLFWTATLVTLFALVALLIVGDPVPKNP